MIIKITDEFNSLPVDIRAKFDHSPEKYVAMYGNEEWATAVGYEVKKTEPATEPTVEAKSEEVTA